MFKLIQNILGKAVFAEVSPVIRTGLKKTLTPNDMPILPRELEADRCLEGFSRIPLDSPWRFLWGIEWVLRKQALKIVGIVFAMATLHLTGPYLIRELLLFIQELSVGSENLTYGFQLAVFLCLFGIIEAVLIQQYIYHALSGIMMVTNGINERLYKHSLRLTRESQQKYPTGDVVNFMGTDCNDVSEFFWTTLEFLYSFLLIISVVTMLLWFLGPAAWAGVATLVLIAPFTTVIAKKFTRLDEEIMSKRDHRVTLISQLLNGIRIVKYFSWGNKALEQVAAIRGKEVKARKQMAMASSWSVMFYAAVTTLVCLASFATHIYLGYELDAATVFSSIALFRLLEGPFGNMTHYISEIAAAKVGADRIRKFLSIELKPENTEPPSARNRPIGVELSHVDVKYADASENVLEGIDLKVPVGSSVAIVGPVGSGKSSLILSLLGEAPLANGSVEFLNLPLGQAPRIAYVPQEAFVLNGSLRENIAFGEKDVEFDFCTKVSCFEQDIKLFPKGLDTEIGEHGVNLSGGQKQRLGLARAAGSYPGLVLLDDPLSAVDVHTEDELVEKLIFGHWEKTTRVVVTHRLKHLARFDQVVFIEDGKISAIGKYAELLTGSARFSEFVFEHSRDEEKQSVALIPPKSEIKSESARDSNGRITEDEDRESGAVKSGVYFDYLRALGGTTVKEQLLVVPLLILATFLVAFTPIIQNAWLSLWTNSLSGESSEGQIAEFLSPLLGTDNQNIVVFGLIGGLVLLLWFGQHLLWSVKSVSAGRILHDQALESVLGTKIRFFDATPVGRILNRFSRDVDAVERNLAWSFEGTVRSLFNTLGSIVVMVIAVPAVFLVIVPVLWLYFKLQKAYRASARESQRLYSISRSPRYAHFKETLTGLSVIRSFRREELFLEKHYTILQESQKMFHGLVSINRWFSTRIPLISSIVSLAVCVSVILMANKGMIQAGTAGLVLVYALSFWENLNWAIRTFSEAEANLTSVERLKHFAELEMEADTKGEPNLIPEQQWPTNGEISFENVRLRYAAHLPEVLKGINFTVRAGTKVGFVGRTGAGKSTLFQALYRFVDLTEGQIKIDGRDISGIPLQRLRRSMAIIPQDPTLFKGTLKENLDRFEKHSDEEIWNVLSRAHMASFVKKLKNGLNAEVKENGNNFSQGQRQLFCLARALLVDAKIIVMDEATASVDIETDVKIQRTIREEFNDKTLLIIAHRLGTVSDCDKVVELSEGRVSQTFEPLNLKAKDLENRKMYPKLEAVP
jgi:ABC-type multidrug transport system fused ATPase/permease subunit